MSTREIPREQWTRFCNSFSRKHQGWETDLEVFSPEIGDQVEQRGLLLAGVAARVSDRCDTIEIMLGGSPGSEGSHLTRVITAPSQVDFQETPEGNSVLQIRSANNSTTLLHLE